MFLHLRAAFLISFAPSYCHQKKKAFLIATVEAVLLLGFPATPLKVINSKTTFPDTTKISLGDCKTKS